VKADLSGGSAGDECGSRENRGQRDRNPIGNDEARYVRARREENQAGKGGERDRFEHCETTVRGALSRNH
jgi:hypothetical protein